MKRMLISTGIIILLVVLVKNLVIEPVAKSCIAYRSIYPQSYTGVIVDKFTRKILFFEIDTGKSNIEVCHLSEELRGFAEIGDTIVKLSGKNECIIYNGAKRKQVKYRWIPPECER